MGIAFRNTRVRRFTAGGDESYAYAAKEFAEESQLPDLNARAVQDAAFTHCINQSHSVSNYRENEHKGIACWLEVPTVSTAQGLLPCVSLNADGAHHKGYHDNIGEAAVEGGDEGSK